MYNNDDYRLLLTKNYENLLIELYKNYKNINDNIIGIKFIYDDNQNIIDIIHLYDEIKSNNIITNLYTHQKISYDKAIKNGFILFETQNDKNKIAYILDPNSEIFRFSSFVRLNILIKLINNYYKPFIINKFINNN